MLTLAIICVSSAAVAAACAVWWFLGTIPLAALLVLYACMANQLFRACLMSGPKTSRQVPPTPIAPCQRLSAVQLSKAYREGVLSCEEVTRTYIEHIKRVNPYINAMVFECFDEAIAAAVQADKVWAKWRANRGNAEPSWLLGVPCTIKESMSVTGCPNASGLPQRRHIISRMDSPVVKNFRDAGAVILGVTNTSELCMWYESSNYVYGISCNPYDTRCIVGGSSGGEGASAGAVFSTFSLGSDIGGSIRMPAFFNGVFGHKASPHYISNRGQHPAPVASTNHYMSTGPISRFAEDLEPLCRVAARGGFLEDEKKFPPRPPLRRLPCIDARKSLRVFILEDFGTVLARTSTTQLEIVREVGQYLEEQFGALVTYVNLHTWKCSGGGEILKVFKPFSKSLRLWLGAMSNDKEEVVFTDLMAEGMTSFSPLKEIFLWVIGRSQHTLPALSLTVVDAVLQHFPKWGPMGTANDTVREFKKSLEELLNGDGVIISPTFPRAAPRHHRPIFSPFDFQYTAAFNVLRMPVTCVPIWQKELRGDMRVPTVEEAKELAASADYHLPKGVQIASREGNDELSLAVAQVLETAFGGYKYPGWAILE
ncbi:amidase, putative [Trypanosoma equiperdum]|uniref:Amidase, putative n=1 Tax=Trypanosoma equiperdum TaxID=5694 RepID=A0A1G4IGM1_TRYEQ|nr:amidase, putative [Trypanosoma equiperdum]